MIRQDFSTNWNYAGVELSRRALLAGGVLCGHVTAQTLETREH